MIDRFRDRVWGDNTYVNIGNKTSLYMFVFVQVQENRENLFYYILFLRLTPIMPNWFVNVACPIVGVPLSCFVSATALGKASMTMVTSVH